MYSDAAVCTVGGFQHEKRFDSMTQTALAPNAQPLFKRILFKISGEALMGSNEFGLDPETVDRIAHDIKDV